MRNVPRVAYLTHYAELYGANRSLLDLMVGLREAGHVLPHVLLPVEGPFTERLRDNGIPFRVIPWRPWMTTRHYEGGIHHRVGQYVRYARAARIASEVNRSLLPVVLEQFREWDIDIVHLNSLAVGMGGPLSSAKSLPLVWHVREMPERHYDMHLDAGRGGYVRALLKADRIIAISQAACEDVRRYIGPEKAVHVVPNGVFTRSQYDRWSARAGERWKTDTPFTFIMAGVLAEAKGHAEAIRALAIVRQVHPDVMLLIAGAGKQERLSALIGELGLQENVRLLGHLEDTEGVYVNAHALLMCSRSEAFGRVTVEAMAHGLPVIGRAEGGTVQILDHGACGLLYTEGAGALAQRMLELIGDRVAARELGQRGMLHVRDRYDVERCVEEVAAIYRELL